MSALLETPLPLGGLVAVYLAFRLKHLISDYFLQTGWMVSGKGAATNWVMPLLAHSSVHAAGTAIIAMIAAPALWWLALVDLAVHALIDRTKAISVCAGRWQPHEPAFWWCHGIDQEAHDFTHLMFVLAIVMA